MKTAGESAPLKKTNAGLVADGGTSQGTPKRNQLWFHAEDNGSQSTAVVDLDQRVTCRGRKSCPSALAHLHGEAAALDLHAVDGNVSLRHLVQEVSAVTRQDSALHLARHAEDDGRAVAVAHLDGDGQLAQHLRV